MADIWSFLQSQHLVPHLLKGYFGLESEQHRLTATGQLSRAPYPSTFSSRQTNPYLKTDFADNMLEMVAPPSQGSRLAVRNLTMIQEVELAHLKNHDFLWPLSVPPVFSATDLHFAGQFNSRAWVAQYHDYLQAKYGTSRELLTGIHINFSFDRHLLTQLSAHLTSTTESAITWQNQLYFQCAQAFVAYRWLFTYLFGASPVAGNQLSGAPVSFSAPVRSLRNSNFGYTNFAEETITYASLAAQVRQLNAMLANQRFFSLHEFYGPVRLKGRATDLADLLANGIERLEFRAFDLDPFAASGIAPTTLDFLELCLAYWLVTRPTLNLTTARERNHAVAMQDPTEVFAWVQREGGQLVAQLREFAQTIKAPAAYFHALATVQQRLQAPTKTPSGRLVQFITSDHQLLNFGITTGQRRYQLFAQDPAPVPVLAETYSVQEQRLLQAAIELGLSISFTPALQISYHHQSLSLTPTEPLIPSDITARQFLCRYFVLE